MLSASLLRLGRGTLALFYDRLMFHKGTGYTMGMMDDISGPHHRLIMTVSEDESQNWALPHDLNRPGEHRLVLLNDMAVRFARRWIILPTCDTK